MNDSTEQNNKNIRYFWRKKKYKHDLLIKNIKELECEEGLDSEVFDFLNDNFESRREKQKNEDNHYHIINSDDDIDDVSSLLLDIVDAETLFPMPPVPFFEEITNNSQSYSKNYVHINVDLHGYTQNGARQEVRRILLNLDKNKKTTIKFNVGKGKHSEDNKQVLPDIVREVCKSLCIHQPSISAKNPGYLQITIDPIKPESNDLKE